MEYKHNSHDDTGYLYLQEEPISFTEEIVHGINIDRDGAGEAVGVEFLYDALDNDLDEGALYAKLGRESFIVPKIHEILGQYQNR